MTIEGYLSEHWGLVVLLMGLGLLLYSDIHLERRMIFRIAATDVMIFLYSVSCYMESYYGELAELSIMRPLLSALDYSLIGFILLNVIMIMFPSQKFYLYIPAVLNSLLCFISVPTGIVFTFSSDNHFGRGPLGYLTYAVCGLYLAYLIIRLFFRKRAEKEDLPLLIFISVTSVLCLVLPLLADEAIHWFNFTVAVNVVLYYIFLLQQFTKHDSLTKLLNRQSYYTDSEKFYSSITALVTMDMDGLKEINDNEGHIAGDTALKALADCFWRAARRGQRVYRIGGDEYIILCLSAKEEEVISLVERIKQEVAKTPYSCSVGYAMKTGDSTIDKLYNLADARLYEEKKVFYETSGKERRKR